MCVMLLTGWVFQSGSLADSKPIFRLYRQDIIRSWIWKHWMTFGVKRFRTPTSGLHEPPQPLDERIRILRKIKPSRNWSQLWVLAPTSPTHGICSSVFNTAWCFGLDSTVLNPDMDQRPIRTQVCIFVILRIVIVPSMLHPLVTGGAKISRYWKPTAPSFRLVAEQVAPRFVARCRHESNFDFGFGHRDRREVYRRGHGWRNYDTETIIG